MRRTIMTFAAIRGTRAMFLAAAISAAALATFSFAPSTFAQGTPEVKRTVLLRQDTLPGQEAVLVDVEIPVGGREGRHTHPGYLLARVESGTLTLDYEGKPTATYKTGDSFIVEPGKIHEGINKSNAPIKVIAAFVVPKGMPMTTQVK
jgi:quercetin dioxygenase-like cupin family protein